MDFLLNHLLNLQKDYLLLKNFGEDIRQLYLFFSRINTILTLDQARIF